MRKSFKIIVASICTLIVVSAFAFTPMLVSNRPLDNQEKALAESMFGNQLNYEMIRIHEGGPLTWIYPGVTLGHLISFPRKAYDPEEKKNQALLLHELTHVWQYENGGWGYALKSLLEEIFQKDAYVIHYDSNKTFAEYDYEEQAEIVASFFLYGTEDYEKYIREIQKRTQ